MSYETLNMAVMENAAHDFNKNVNIIKKCDLLLSQTNDEEKKQKLISKIHFAEREIYLVFDFLLNPDSNKYIFAPNLDGKEMVKKMLKSIPEKYRKGCLKRYANT